MKSGSIAKSLKLKSTIVDNKSATIQFMHEPRDYQSELIDRTFTAWTHGAKVLLQLATGGGKTVIFANIAREFTQKGQPIIAFAKRLHRRIAHREELIAQAANKLQLVTIEQKHLSPFKFYSPTKIIRAASSGLKTKGGDYNARELTELVRSKCILGDAFAIRGPCPFASARAVGFR